MYTPRGLHKHFSFPLPPYTLNLSAGDLKSSPFDLSSNPPPNKQIQQTADGWKKDLQQSAEAGYFKEWHINPTSSYSQTRKPLN